MLPRNVIIDTDIGPDCDDAAALALAAIYTVRAGGKLLGAMHCTSSRWGAGAIRAVLDWYGMHDTAVGTLADPGFLNGPECEKYNLTLAMSVSAEARTASDCLPLYRHLLAEQPDGSVDIVAIGPLRNLYNLLRSAGDDISPLSGHELIARKVRRLTLMAGEFSPGCETAEWNVKLDLDAARAVAAEWPGEIVYCGYEVGLPVIMLKGENQLAADNPVRTAYRLYSGDSGRMSWDPCTVQQAMADDCGLYKLSPCGRITIDECGVTRWTAEAGGMHRFVKLAASPEDTAKALENELARWDFER